MMWIPVEQQMPQANTPVLAWLVPKPGMGKPHGVRAMYAPPKTLECNDDFVDGFGEYDEEQDIYWCPEGWYEWNDDDEVHWHKDPGHGTVTHWMEITEPDADTRVERLENGILMAHYAIQAMFAGQDPADVVEFDQWCVENRDILPPAVFELFDKDYLNAEKADD